MRRSRYLIHNTAAGLGLLQAWFEILQARDSWVVVDRGVGGRCRFADVRVRNSVAWEYGKERASWDLPITPSRIWAGEGR